MYYFCSVLFALLISSLDAFVTPDQAVPANSQLGAQGSTNSSGLSDSGTKGPSPVPPVAPATSLSDAPDLTRPSRGQDAGERFLKSLVRTESARQTARNAFSFISSAWVIVAVGVVVYLGQLAIFPKVREWFRDIKTKRFSQWEDDSSSEEEDEETVKFSPPKTFYRPYPPASLLPHTVDERIANEAAAYIAG